jgi:hypothetical protein
MVPEANGHPIDGLAFEHQLDALAMSELRRTAESAKPERVCELFEHGTPPSDCRTDGGIALRPGER